MLSPPLGRRTEPEALKSGLAVMVQCGRTPSSAMLIGVLPGPPTFSLEGPGGVLLGGQKLR